jgi:hypothetical protein
MTDPSAIIHLLTVLCGTVSIIITAGVFISVRDRLTKEATTTNRRKRNNT